MLFKTHHLIPAALAALMRADMPFIKVLPEFQWRPVKATRITTGRRYPHSSKRQRSRYARQLAAGQIKFRD